MMDDVEVSDIVEEEAALPSQEVPVNGGSGSTLEVPFLATVVRKCGVGVVEVCDHDDYLRECQVNGKQRGWRDIHQ